MQMRIERAVAEKIAAQHAAASETTIAAVQPHRDPEPSREQRLKQALAHLERGEGEIARGVLLALLPQDKDGTATELLRQLDEDPQEALGSEHFTYTLGPGDSLAVVARNFLGDSNRFYVLARYNGIRVPERIHAGQTIKVPKAQPGNRQLTALQPVNLPSPDRELQRPLSGGLALPPAESGAGTATVYEAARGLTRAGRHEEAVRMLESLLAGRPNDAEAARELAEALAEFARAAARDEDFVRMGALLKRARALRPGTDEYLSDANEAERLLAAKRSYEQGLRLGEQQKIEEAYQSFARALVLRPGYESAESEIGKLRPVLVEQYNREALALFRRQALDEAIQIWDRALAVDPNHAASRTYRKRAVELKGRLSLIAKPRS
jgi:tetratricopeptide (TPR) repeat protein